MQRSAGLLPLLPLRPNPRLAERCAVANCAAAHLRAFASAAAPHAYRSAGPVRSHPAALIGLPSCCCHASRHRGHGVHAVPEDLLPQDEQRLHERSLTLFASALRVHAGMLTSWS
jgi:hypothetical protein